MDEAPELQFDRAEPIPVERHTCAVCHQTIAEEHFRVNEAKLCPFCAAALLDHHQPASGASTVLRSVVYGAGAAVVGGAAMAVVAAISGYRLSLLSIAAGFLVGKAMRIGSAGRGSRTLQVLAALLTYVAVTGSYFPPSGNVADFITCLAIPFFQIASGMQGLLGIFILAVGMAQAWRMMAHPKLPITGPHTVQL